MIGPFGGKGDDLLIISLGVICLNFHYPFFNSSILFLLILFSFSFSYFPPSLFPIPLWCPFSLIFLFPNPPPFFSSSFISYSPNTSSFLPSLPPDPPSYSLTNNFILVSLPLLTSLHLLSKNPHLSISSYPHFIP